MKIRLERIGSRVKNSRFPVGFWVEGICNRLPVPIEKLGSDKQDVWRFMIWPPIAASFGKHFHYFHSSPILSVKEEVYSTYNSDWKLTII